MFESVLAKQFPRILTQVCRDKHSPFYGCFDRNWWHYRIRDFSSIMLQQGGYLALQYARHEEYFDYREQLRELAWVAAIFWDQRAGKRGAFEEYYPWEQGYPPLAFSTLAMAKLVAQDVVYADDIDTGLKKAARQLQQRFEKQAGNQQVAGLAALGVIRKIQPDLVDEEKFVMLKEKTLALQNEEGWFTEYDGPDLGYLSVTLDCLYDLFDYTGDAEFLLSAERALKYMHGVVVRRKGGIGMQNARNTDYIVPYGIFRFLEHDNPEFRQFAGEVIMLVYADMDAKTHFFNAIDDRYWIHYVGHSVARAQLLLNRIGKQKFTMKSRLAPTHVYTSSGYIFREVPGKDIQLMISGKKGGVFSVYNGEKTLHSDYGWVITNGKKQHVNHWWSDSWKFEVSDTRIRVHGSLFPHSEKISTPLLHAGLRVASFFFGRRLTGVLRNVLIFKSKKSAMRFERKIDLSADALIVTDTIEGIGKQMQLQRAPRASKRHVASADSWHHEDFALHEGEVPTEMIIRKDERAVITTTIHL